MVDFLNSANIAKRKATLLKSLVRKQADSTAGMDQTSGGLWKPKGVDTPKQPLKTNLPDPTKLNPTPSALDKVKAGAGAIQSGKRSVEGAALTGAKKLATGAGKATRGWIRAKAGAPTLEGDSSDPGGDLDTGPDAGAQEVFAQQSQRKQSQQFKRNQRMNKRQWGSDSGQSGAKSPQNVQNRPPVQIQNSFNPALASLLAVSAGFAASGAVVNAAGGRGARSITDDQLNLFNVMADKKRRKLRKEHSPLPPIQGLVWDQGAQRWRRPENVGKTASEVQGKKRIRGSGIGQTARSPGGTAAGKGRGRAYSRGRAQRAATGDIGVAGTHKGKASARKRRKRRG